jgi:hypothetical protein
MIVTGKRNLTIHNIHLIIRGFKLSKKQAELFEAMVLMEQAEIGYERRYYKRRFLDLGKQLPQENVRISSDQLLQSWIGPVLLSFLEQEEPEVAIKPEKISEIADKLGVPQDEVKNILAWICTQHDFKNTKNANKHFLFEKVGNSLIQEQYVRQAFAECVKRIPKEYKSKSSLFSVKTLNIDSREIENLAIDYKVLLEKYLKLDNHNSNFVDKQSVVQICFGILNLL